MTDAAAYIPHSVDILDWNCLRPSGKVNIFGSWRIWAATMYSDQDDINENSAVITNAGLANGSITL